MDSVILLNDSFPPLIDGVANAVTNYASTILAEGCEPIVLTPAYPDADDSKYPYPVIRYPSIDFRNQTGYMAGVPFSPEIMQKLENRDISILHSHCPIASTMLARELHQVLDVPLVLTYHTKFDIDIANVLKSKALQDIGKFALLRNINACDEVWAVSKGAVDNLRSLGYEGECIVMENGVDLPRGSAPETAVAEIAHTYPLPDNVPIFLFVGRMMWYKGIRIILDALAELKAAGTDFNMVFIGGGTDLQEIQTYADSLQITDRCLFTGPVYDRNLLRAWYCRADLFLFPSTFDTNGLVVREAAACGLAAVLISGSCAAEDVTDGVNGILISESAESMYDCLKTVSNNPAYMKQIGENACRDLYLSWEESVKRAMERYEIVIDKYKSGGYTQKRKPADEILRTNGELMEGLAHFMDVRESIRMQLSDRISARNARISEQFNMLTSQVERVIEDIREKL